MVRLFMNQAEYIEHELGLQLSDAQREAFTNFVRQILRLRQALAVDVNRSRVPPAPTDLPEPTPIGLMVGLFKKSA